jgi:hypothetical protein
MERWPPPIPSAPISPISNQAFNAARNRGQVTGDMLVMLSFLSKFIFHFFFNSDFFKKKKFQFFFPT